VNEQRELHLARLKEAISEASKLLDQGVVSWTPAFMGWRDRTIQSLEVIYGKDNGYKKRFESLRFEEGRDDLDPRLWDAVPNSFAEDFHLAEQLIRDAIEDAPAPAPPTTPRTLGDPALILEAQRLYHPELGRATMDAGKSRTVMSDNKPDPRKVFVIHGRNSRIREDLFSFIRAMDLNPLEWPEAVALTGKASPYVGEVLDAAFREVQAVIVLLTPDDDVRLSKSLWAQGESADETKYSLQARPNVLFEAGMSMGRDPDHTLLIQVGKVKKFSDVGGRHILHLTNDAGARQAVVARLHRAGCPVSMAKADWLKAGHFDITPVKAPSKKPARQKGAGETAAKRNPRPSQKPRD
jgi:predicted nucleotide-binding protein